MIHKMIPTPAWFAQDGTLPRLCQPLAWLYGAGARLMRAKPYAPILPTILVGNVTAGGAGKTPVVRAIARWLRDQGVDTHVILRGYGGREAGPRRVAPDNRDVGDEARLHARDGVTWVARHRPDGLNAAAAAGARLAVLDDGMQSLHLQSGLTVLVIDGPFGIGNGRLLPAGPLREPLVNALTRSDGCIIIGPDPHRLAEQAQRINPAITLCRVQAKAQPPPGPLAAFAGLARPEKFFESLHASGGQVVATRRFADHHPYRPQDLRALEAWAQQHNAQLVTTEKDAMRLPPDFALVAPLDLDWLGDSRAQLLSRIAGACHTKGIS
ncbi:MAG: tetraacyldisaccharide 4'-kinase [Pseudomonadota bacterium]